MKIRIQFSIDIPPFIEDCLPSDDNELAERLKTYKAAMSDAANYAALNALVKVHNNQ